MPSVKATVEKLPTAESLFWAFSYRYLEDGLGRAPLQFS